MDDKNLAPEEVRNVANKLRRLATLEAMVVTGCEELQEFTKDVCDQLTAWLGGTDGSPLSVLPRSDEEWIVGFRRRTLLRFEVRAGIVPAAEARIASCKIYPETSERPLATCYLVKVGDVAEWRAEGLPLSSPLASADESRLASQPTKVTAGWILRMIHLAVELDLKVYPKANA